MTAPEPLDLTRPPHGTECKCEVCHLALVMFHKLDRVMAERGETSIHRYADAHRTAAYVIDTLVEWGWSPPALDPR